jgi:hypothetical protein
MAPQADFIDRRVVPLSRADASAVDIFHALFGHRPWWMKGVMVLRNRLARWAGLAAPSVAEIMRPSLRKHYEVGQKIGAWPIDRVNATELVAGRDNSHMDFRLSIVREAPSSGSHHADHAVVTTRCFAHNRFGRVYLAVIKPFHRWGMAYLIRSAIQAGRL